MIIPRRLAIGLVLALTACGHGDRFTVPGYGTEQPLAPGNPLRLTYNPGPDYDPAWLADGSAVIYSSAQLWRDDDDHCLALLPPAGGRARDVLCDNTGVTLDSTTHWISPSVSPGGRLAYMQTSRRIGSPQPLTAALMLGRLDSAGGVGRVHLTTFTVPEFLPLGGVSHLTWLGEHGLVYRGNFEGMLCEVPAPQCQPIFVRSGRGLVFVPAFAPALTRALPGTAFASSVTRDADDDEIFFTLGGDGRVYRQVVSTGVTTVVFDFGATIARDVQVRGNRLVAITGGAVSWQDRASDGWIQFDHGGDLVYVDLAAPAPQQLSPVNMLLRRPALSPDGRSVVAESGGDLYLFTLP